MIIELRRDGDFNKNYERMRQKKQGAYAGFRDCTLERRDKGRGYR